MGNTCTCLQDNLDDEQVIDRSHIKFFPTEPMNTEENDINNNMLKQSLSIQGDDSIQLSAIPCNRSEWNNDQSTPDKQFIVSPQSNRMKATPVKNQNTKKSSTAETRKSPLEVINEINGERSGDIRDGLSQHNHHVKKEEAMKLYDCNNNKPKHNSHKNCSYNRSFSLDSTEVKNVNRKYVQKMALKKSWRDIQISTIIPVSKLKDLNDNDLLIQGEFYKSTKDKDLKRYVLTSNFLFLTKAHLRIYRSKEAVIYRQSPLQIINLFNIVSCELITLHSYQPTGQNQRSTFMIEYLLSNSNGIIKPDTIGKLQNISQFDISLSKIQFDASMMKNKAILKHSFKQNTEDSFNQTNTNEESATERKKGKKMTLLGCDKDDMTSLNKNDDMLFKNNVTSKIFFSLDNGENVMKWVCAINYLISR